MKTKQNFISQSFQSFSDEPNLIIEKHLQDLDRVSNDIKALESKLKLAGIPFNFVYPLSSKKECYSEKTSNQIGVYEEFSYMGDFIRPIEDCLTWGKSESGDYRLRHTTYVAIDEIDGHDNGNGNNFENTRRIQELVVSSRKPPIETKSNFRLRIEKELPIFYKKMIEALKNERDQDEVVEVSPNFKGEFSLLGLPF